MSPRAALASPIYCFYATGALGLLVLGGVVLALLKCAFRKDVDHALRAYYG
jgi:hypothetical protein